MKKFLTRLFAVLGVIATAIVGLTALLVWSWLGKVQEEPQTPDNMILTLDFSSPVIEKPNDFKFSLPRMMYAEDDATPLATIVRALEHAARDPKVKGVIANFGSERPTLVHAQEIAIALDKFRASGKFSYVFAPTYGDFTQGGSLYYLASRFENIWLQPVGAVALTPLAIEAPFGKTALGKFGVTTDFMRREEYKSVMENVSQDSFSPTVKANMQSMLNSLSDQIAQGIAAGRKLDLAKVKEIIENGPYTAVEALKLGLVTKLAYYDQFLDEAKEKAGKDAKMVDPATYLYYASHANKDKPKAKIALIYADGMIVSDKPKGPARMAQDDVIDTDEIVDAFDDAVKDKDVKAIIFRINSPGGSPVASETIRRALIRAKEKKPVFVSMGRVAASGGYWIAMDATRIIADPATITGSIGVIAGKFVLGGLFDKLGITWDTINANESTNMWSTRAPFTPKGRERMNVMLDETYKAFTDNVAAARKIAPDKMPDIAKGRVFTGEQAVGVGLVDDFGGMNATIESVKANLKLNPEDKVALAQFPAPESPTNLLFRVLHNVGLASELFQGSIGDLQQVRSTLHPYLDALSDSNRVTAKLPSPYLLNGR